MLSFFYGKAFFTKPGVLSTVYVLYVEMVMHALLINYKIMNNESIMLLFIHCCWNFVLFGRCNPHKLIKSTSLIPSNIMHLLIASPAPGDPGHGGDHAGTVRERTKNVARLCRGV